MHSEVLPKILSAIGSSLPLTVCLHNWVTTGSSAISNQLVVGSIMVRAIKLTCELSLPLRVYGPMRSTHKHSHGLVMMVFGGRCPYLKFHLLFTWQDLQDFVNEWMVVRIPFQYITVSEIEKSYSNFQLNSRVRGFLANCNFTDFPFWKKSLTLTPPAFDFLKTV
jgi:hypothetical protein